MSTIFERYDATIDIYSERKENQPALDRSYLCFKIILLMANLIFVIFGCVLCGVGSYALNSDANMLAGVTLPVGIIVMGVFTILLAGLGAVSAWKESRLGLGVYFGLLMLITVILFAVAVTVYTKRSQASLILSQAWYTAPVDVKNDVQEIFGCCGWNAFNDTSAYHPCPAVAYMPVNRPCLSLITDAFSSNLYSAGACGIAFAVLMGMGMFIVCCLMRGIKKKRNADLEVKLDRQMQPRTEEDTSD